MPLIIIYDLRKNKAPDKFFPRKSRICQGLKIYFQMFMKKMEEFRKKDQPHKRLRQGGLKEKSSS